jgi:outer membrane cobalamin receptor
MRNIRGSAVAKHLLLASSAGTMIIASPVIAQDAISAAAEDPVTTGDQIVVTGSRIARQDFESTSPIVTIDEALLEQSSTAAIEQNLNKLPQFTPAKTPTGGARGVG